VAAKAKKKASKKAASKKSATKKAKPNSSKTKKLLARPRQHAAAGSKSKAKSKTGSATQTSNRAGKPANSSTANGSLLPSRDGVLVERIAESDRTPGGLYIPQSVQEKPVKGIVVRAGKGKISKRGKLRPLDVQPGDEVLFGKFAGTEIKIDGKEYLLIREDEILGVVS
jgi:chaperonin GroES